MISEKTAERIARQALDIGVDATAKKRGLTRETERNGAACVDATVTASNPTLTL